jgi:hypothetical protein
VNGDIGTLSANAEERYARLYLARASIAVPPGGQSIPIRVVSGLYRFDSDRAGWEDRLVQVRIDPTDGRLLMLENLPQQSQKQPPARRP